MIVEVVGWIGAGLILLDYILLTTDRLNSHEKRFHIINLAGSLGILINAFYHGAIPSVVLNLVFLLVAIFGEVRAKRF
jgi:hypothetical protein